MLQRHEIAAELHRRLPFLKTILQQTEESSGELRTRRLDWLFGKRRTCTLHSENGCRFAVDLASTYFSPRLLHERARIAALVGSRRDRETVINMFSGVGCFSIQIAKASPASIVYSININPDAVRYMLKNVRINKVEGKVVVMLGDSRRLTGEFLTGRTDRVLLPMPETSLLYVHAATMTIRKAGAWFTSMTS
ncbi:MAG: hypothetical protein V1857_00945 [archaeon]